MFIAIRTFLKLSSREKISHVKTYISHFYDKSKVKKTFYLMACTGIYNCIFIKTVETLKPDYKSFLNGSSVATDSFTEIMKSSNTSVAYHAFREEILYRYPLVSKFRFSHIPQIYKNYERWRSSLQCSTAKLEGNKIIFNDLGKYYKGTVESDFLDEIRLQVTQATSKYYWIYIYSHASNCIISGTHLICRNTMLGKITYPIFVGSMCSNFTFAHLSNYPIVDENALLTVAGLQGFSGIIMTYIALSMGLRYSVLFHIVHNMIIINVNKFI